MESWSGATVLLAFLVHRVVVSRFASLWYGAEPKVSREERQLAEEISGLKAEAKRLNRMDTFVDYAKTTRLVVAREKELAKLEAVRTERYAALSPLHRRVISLLQEALLPVLCFFWFRGHLFASLCPVVEQDPACWSFGGEWISGWIGSWMAWPLEPHRSGPVPYGSVGVVAWMLACHGAVKGIVSAFL